MTLQWRLGYHTKPPSNAVQPDLYHLLPLPTTSTMPTSPTARFTPTAPAPICLLGTCHTTAPHLQVCRHPDWMEEPRGAQHDGHHPAAGETPTPTDIHGALGVLLAVRVRELLGLLGAWRVLGLFSGATLRPRSRTAAVAVPATTQRHKTASVQNGEAVARGPQFTGPAGVWAQLAGPSGAKKGQRHRTLHFRSFGDHFRRNAHGPNLIALRSGCAMRRTIVRGSGPFQAQGFRV